MLSIEYHSSATSVFLLFIPQVLALPGYIAFMEKKKNSSASWKPELLPSVSL